MRVSHIFLTLCLVGLFVGCETPPSQTKVSHSQARVKAAATTPTEKQAETPVQTEESTFAQFSIYKDKGTRSNHFIPSGFMPNGKCLKLNDRWTESCQEGKTCIRIDYNLECSSEDQNWSGIYWLNPPNNWGKYKGGYNLIGAQKLSFWARGEQGGERIQEFKIGGIEGDFPDSDMAIIGPVILSNEWREYSIDLRGKDLSYISGGFGWATNVDVNIENTPENTIFYLDNIRYE